MLREELKRKTLNETLVEHNLSLKEAFELCMKNNLQRKTYIQKLNSGYRIRKNVNRRLEYFGVYTSFDDAIKVRDRLIETGWDINQLNDICMELGVELK